MVIRVSCFVIRLIRNIMPALSCIRSYIQLSCFHEGHQKSSLSLLFFPLPAPAPAPAFLPLPAPFLGALSSSSESSPLAPFAGASGTLPTMSLRLSNCSSCITADFMCWERTRLEPRCLATPALAEMRRIINNSSALATGHVSKCRRQRERSRKTYPLLLE
jgi:hypothetical protein